MQKVDAYIDYQFKGNFAAGTGKISIVLELVDQEGIPHTREHYCGYSNTTNIRLCILACIKALEKFKKPCEIEIHINSSYIDLNVNGGKIEEWLVSNWISNGKEIKNKDLWQQYIELADKHLIIVKNEKRNSYTGVMEMELEKREIELQEDIRN